MNLRKDHCRYLPEADREHVLNGSRGRGAGLLVPLRVLGDPPPAPSRRRAGLTNPGAECAKENRNEAPSLRPSPVRGMLRTGGTDARQSITRVSESIKTTLGNGYLGSRIDEERSKMRYLV